MKKYKSILALFFCVIMCLSFGASCTADSVSNNSNGIIGGGEESNGAFPPMLSDEIDSRELWGEDAGDIREGERRARGDTENAPPSAEGSLDDDKASVVLVVVLLLLTFAAAAFLIYLAFRSMGKRRKERE